MRKPDVDSLPVSPNRHDWSRRAFVRSGLVALGAPALVGCLNPTRPESSGSPRITARPGTPSVTPTLGLTDLGLGAGRDGLLYVPQGYSSDTPAPLFVALHGAGGQASNWASYPDRAEAHGMVLLVPDSRSSTWDLIRGGGFGPDVEFLDHALTYTFERCRIDPSRIALGGFSDGATYALSLGVANGDLFTHLVAYSPGYLATTDSLVGHPKVFISHGVDDFVLPVASSRDNIVPYLEGAGYEVTYEEFDGGHEVPAAISEMALDWFLNEP